MAIPLTDFTSKNQIPRTLNNSRKVEQGIQLIGVDYLSAGSMLDGALAHKILLGSDVIILEGVNLSQVISDQYELICLPLKISGAEGAPARAILRK